MITFQLQHLDYHTLLYKFYSPILLFYTLYDYLNLKCTISPNSLIDSIILYPVLALTYRNYIE